nr:hypothetical protein CTI12_AA090750 [Tanacetum cinerariifolium]
MSENPMSSSLSSLSYFFSSAAPTNSEKEKQGDENQNNQVETLTLSKKQHQLMETLNLTDSNNSNRNEKNDEGDIDSGAQDMEQVPNENKDDASVLEDEKDALTDLGTLPDNETEGHITNEDSDTE